MQANARKVFKKLEKIGLTVMEQNWSRNAHFEIAVEDDSAFQAQLNNKKIYWADYYELYWGTDELNLLLAENELFFEWINPAVIGVYDA